jgi:hypothetical protein
MQLDYFIAEMYEIKKRGDEIFKRLDTETLSQREKEGQYKVLILHETHF